MPGSRSPGSTRSRPATSSSLDPVAADWWRALYLATLALIVVFRVAVPAVAGVPPPAAGRRGGRGGAGRRLAPDHRPEPRAAARPRRAVLPLAVPRPRPLVDGAPVLALRGAGRALAADHRQGARRPHRAARRRSARHPRRRRGPVRRLHRRRAAPREGRCSSPAGSGSRRSARSSTTLRATSSSSTASSREDELVLRDELERPGATVHYVVGDHATPGSERLLSPEHLRELVPDVAEREVFLCGPPAMTAAIERTLAQLPRPAPPRPRRTIRPLDLKGNNTMRKPCSRCCSAPLAIALPHANAVAAAPRRRRSSSRKKFTGTAAQADRWGYVQVTITVRKTTPRRHGKKKVTRRMTDLTATSPEPHRRSVFINDAGAARSCGRRRCRRRARTSSSSPARPTSSMRSASRCSRRSWRR